MKYLKNALIFFFAIDISMFIMSQVAPGLFVSLLPQFNIESTDNIYPRAVGTLFLMLGLARLYGGLYINEKGALIVSMWSWIVELVYTIIEIFHGQFIITENVMAVVLAPLMLAWSVVYYKKTFNNTSTLK